jgi:hypothetical protein
MKLRNLYLVFLFINSSIGFIHNIPMKTIGITNKNNYLSLRCANNDNNINNKIKKLLKSEQIIIIVKTVKYTVIYLSISTFIQFLKLLLVNYFNQ